MRCCLTSLVVLLVVIGIIAAGGFLYLKSPEMRPLITYLPSFSWEQVSEGVPFLHPAYESLPPLSQEQQQDQDTLLAERDKPRQAMREREQQALKQVQATGLPVGEVHVLETALGEPILTVGLDYERMTSGSDPGQMLGEGVQSFVCAVEAKSFDLTGMSYLTMAVRDDGGRVLFAVTAATPDIEAFRTGKITRRQFIAKTAAQFQSREAGLDFIGQVVR